MYCCGLQGQRQKRLQAGRLREEKEERERQEVDRREAEFQAQQRREAIERAQTLLYHQTDRLKHFHVGMVAMLHH